MSDDATKVTPARLRRDAYLYIRQSTLYQVIHNTESTARQYDLKGRAVALGWPEDKIHVIDIDQGRSGASAADRAGFQQLVAEVSLGGPASCSAWNAPGWPATPPTGSSSSRSAPTPTRSSATRTACMTRPSSTTASCWA